MTAKLRSIALLLGPALLLMLVVAIWPLARSLWFGFTETNINGVTGYRCRTLQEFMQAAIDVKKLKPKTIRDTAVNKYSLEAIAPRYEAFFRRLETLWGDGWYQVQS